MEQMKKLIQESWERISGFERAEIERRKNARFSLSIESNLLERDIYYKQLKDLVTNEASVEEQISYEIGYMRALEDLRFELEGVESVQDIKDFQRIAHGVLSK